jgi:hypothetical protein
MDAKRFQRAETVSQWKALVLSQVEGCCGRQVEYAETFLKVPPPAWALMPVKAAA